jgi:hypothetical protein
MGPRAALREALNGTEGAEACSIEAKSRIETVIKARASLVRRPILLFPMMALGCGGPKTKSRTITPGRWNKRLEASR